MRSAVWIVMLMMIAASTVRARDTRLMLDMPDSLSLPAAFSEPGTLVWTAPTNLFSRFPGLGDSLGQPSLTLGFHRAISPRRFEVTTFQHISEGMGKGANLGLGLGYIGTLVGWWDDETALYMMAAGAAMGASAQGLTTSERSRVRWGFRGSRP